MLLILLLCSAINDIIFVENKQIIRPFTYITIEKVTFINLSLMDIKIQIIVK